MNRLFVMFLLGCLAIPANLHADDAVDYFNRGVDSLRKGKHDKAITDFTAAIRLDPNYEPAYALRGIAWGTKGDCEKAIADFNQAVAINPKDAPAHNDLAWLYATCPDKNYRDGKKAVENANKAYRLTAEKNCGCLDTLAAAYAENGDFKKARELEAKVIEMAVTDKSVTATNKADAASRLELYKQNKPYHEEPKRK